MQFLFQSSIIISESKTLDHEKQHGVSEQTNIQQTSPTAQNTRPHFMKQINYELVLLFRLVSQLAYTINDRVSDFTQ
jgi:hypothetical protein